jgi:hypothetical protein
MVRRRVDLWKDIWMKDWNIIAVGKETGLIAVEKSTENF